MTDIAAKWSKGVASELQFWQFWFQSKGGPWPDDYRARLDPKKPFSKAVEHAVRHPTAGALEIVDVGAGPITSLGYASGRFDTRITATDALAEAYSVLLAEAGVDPPVRTIKCAAENVLQHFASRRFHVCHSRNALDHCVDPRRAILAMAQLLHPNGLLYMEVYKNEGEKAKYEGLHSWNFDKDEDNHFILWRDTERHDISADLGHLGEWQLADQGDSLVFTAYPLAA